MDHIYEYVESLERRCIELSTRFDRVSVEEEGTDGQRATICGRLTLSEGTFLSFRETVEVGSGFAQRVKYSYYLIREGTQEWGFDRDPSHEPEEHMHRGPAHERVATRGVTLKQAMKEAWETISEAAEVEVGAGGCWPKVGEHEQS